MINSAVKFFANDDDFRVNHTSAAVDKNGGPLNDATIAAWMAWELKMKEQDVDIREIDVLPISRIPLGSYVSDLIRREARNFKKKREYGLKDTYIAKDMEKAVKF